MLAICRKGVLYLFCLTLLAPLAALSQSGPDTGFPAFGTFNRDAIDTINVGNLNIHLEMPMFSKKGRGLDFSSKISFDNTPYRPIPPSCQGCNSADNWQGIPTWVVGGVSGMGSLTYMTRSNGTRDPVCYLGGQGTPQTLYTIYYGFAYADESNTVHSFGGLQVGYPAGCIATSGTGLSLGGYTFSVVVNPTSGAFTTLSMTDANGNLQDFLARTLKDPYGNTMSVSGGYNSSLTWADTTGNTPLSATFGASPWTFNYPNPAGSPSEQVSVAYSNLTHHTNYQSPLPCAPDSGSNFLGPAGPYITGITLADRSTYTLVYESTSGTYPSTTTTGRF